MSQKPSAEAESSPGGSPWLAQVPMSLADRARAAVTKAPEQVRALVEDTIEGRAINAEDAGSLNLTLGVHPDHHRAPAVQLESDVLWADHMGSPSLGLSHHPNVALGKTTGSGGPAAFIPSRFATTMDRHDCETREDVIEAASADNQGSNRRASLGGSREALAAGCRPATTPTLTPPPAPSAIPIRGSTGESPACHA